MVFDLIPAQKGGGGDFQILMNTHQHFTEDNKRESLAQYYPKKEFLEQALVGCTAMSHEEQTAHRVDADFLIWIQLESIYFFKFWLLPTIINNCLGNSSIAYVFFRAFVSSRNSAHNETQVSQNVQK